MIFHHGKNGICDGWQGVFIHGCELWLWFIDRRITKIAAFTEKPDMGYLRGLGVDDSSKMAMVLLVE